MDIMEAIKQRRSIRSYKDDPVPVGLLDQVLEAGRLAPSSSNVQSWRFKVVTDKAAKGELRKAAMDQSFVEEAPAVIVACLDLDAFRERTRGIVELLKDEDGSVKDCDVAGLFALCDGPDEKRCLIHAFMNVSIAVENMVLTAVSLGLGTCWVRAFEPLKVAHALSLPPECPPAVLLPIGFPNQDPPARPRKEMHEIRI
ncbi:MAG: hypothetical protein A2W01_10135 [Candidatus Solincola sediminis]|uniref:Nitroreductase domain-containing protein n=1 Tax=Candidatus Solincola sediminis TaxID=1797199 RepID=A0A1F2WGV5_9ACTN|nr:MAG: hypothetical protein A2Y75_00800 [Candidatus Solincola sediminis]OFW56622.1 MAG: hypothetical protein A2W01_10135 [Candidatus Solincola sediminis]